MREINKSYFSSLSKFVNTDAYNVSCVNEYRPILFDDYLDEDLLCKIQSLIKLNGFCIVQIDSNKLDARKKFEDFVSNIFGDPFTYKNPDKQAYAKVQAQDQAKFYINSNVSQPMHTDEGYTRVFPRYIALYCAQAASEGGQSIIVQFQQLYTQLLHQFGEIVNVLFEHDATTVQNAYGIEKKPILLRLENSSVGITYSPVLQKMWCSQDVFTLFDYITQYAHNPINQLRFSLRPNQALLMDNCNVLHGRVSFSNSNARLLYRYWFKESSVC
jgi:alpha-ketoglutarate-dependent taurine dioxygenase